jgi:predicted nuclease of predicted toxin-antitoxin system
MKFWLNANLAPKIAKWLCQEFKIDCVALLELKEESLSDEEIFKRARMANAVVITLDFIISNKYSRLRNKLKDCGSIFVYEGAP